MNRRDKHIYIGVDVHKQQHTAVIVNCWGEKLGDITFKNKPAAFPEFIKEIERHSKKDMTPVFGLEDVGGHGRSLAVFLKEQGYQVKAVNAALSYMERRSYPTTQKNDSWDAQCVAEVLARKFTQLPDANPIDIYWTISQLVGRRNTLVKDHASLKNQLHLHLSHNYPSYKQFFAEIDGKTALAFWERFPSPHCLEGVSVEQLTTFLLQASSNACSIRKAETIRSLVAADGDTKREYQESRDGMIQSIVRHLRFIKQEMRNIEKELKRLVGTLGYQLETMPGIDVVTASALIAEIGDIYRFPNADKLARFAGIAPVFFGSGGKGDNHKSRQGNRVLHSLFYNLAVQQVQIAKCSHRPRNPVFYQYYLKKLAEGKSKKQALVCVMRKLVNIIYGMMKSKTAYLPPLPRRQAS